MTKKYLLAFVMLTMICITACNKDGQSGNQNNFNKLAGTWVYTTPVYTDYPLTYEFKFNADGTMQSVAYSVNPTTGNIDGYTYKQTGKYNVNESNILELTDLVTYTNDVTKRIPVPESELLSQKNPFIMTHYHYSVNNMLRKLDLSFICPPNASCPPAQFITYNKK